MTDLNWSELWDEAEQRYRVMTRNGRKVRVFTIDARGGRPVVGEREYPTGEYVLNTWQLSGVYGGNNKHLDLIPEPRTVRRWVNVYRKTHGGHEIGDLLHNSKEEARHGHTLKNNRKYIATVPVEWEE